MLDNHIAIDNTVYVAVVIINIMLSMIRCTKQCPSKNHHIVTSQDYMTIGLDLPGSCFDYLIWLCDYLLYS